MKIAIPNDNNKLGCKFFLHIAAVPAEPVPESKMGGIYCIVNGDKEFNARLETFIRCKLGDVPMYFIALSAGTIDVVSWTLKMMEGGKLKKDSDVGIYLYEKVDL